MPLHRLFVPPNLYSEADKSAIAAAITGVYPMLPAFYVVVIFITVEKGDFYVGGKQRHDFVRLAVENIARKLAEWVLHFTSGLVVHGS